MFLFDTLQKPLRQVGNALLKILDGSLKGSNIRSSIVEELVEYISEVLRLCQIDLKNGPAVLVEDSAARILKDGIGDGIACADLLADLGTQIVPGVLGLPVAAWKIEAIAQGAIGTFAIG